MSNTNNKSKIEKQKNNQPYCSDKNAEEISQKMNTASEMLSKIKEMMEIASNNDFTENVSKMPRLERAKMNGSIAYTINSLFCGSFSLFSFCFCFNLCIDK